MASYWTSFFYWWSPADEKEPIIIQAAARNMPNGMLDPSKLSKEEAATKCTLQRTCIPICVTKNDLENINLRKTKTRPPKTRFMPRSPVCEELLLREYKKSIQQILIEELTRYFKERPGLIVM
ncbi:hypothetical protein DRO61_04780 [Candidatus Bathyarchaeota archaeon]|nr:MAG: hypothetical protein DRO61_04780 [Candidatus Bathyarchaeota archaeon]